MTRYLLQTTCGNISGHYMQELNLHYGSTATTDKKEKALIFTEEEAKVLCKFFPELVGIRDSGYYLVRPSEEGAQYISFSKKYGALWVTDFDLAFLFYTLKDAISFRDMLIRVDFHEANEISIEDNL